MVSSGWPSSPGGLLSKLSGRFWSQEFWLPPNVTWADLDPDTHPEAGYADFRHLGYPFLLLWVIVGARVLLEGTVFRHLGRRLGISDSAFSKNSPGGKRNQRPPPVGEDLSNSLEDAFNARSMPPDGPEGRPPWTDHELAESLARDAATVVTVRQVQRWLRWRHRREVLLRKALAAKKSDGRTAKSELDKFSECGFRWCLYLGLFAIGLVVVPAKDWFWDTSLCWVDYPLGHRVDPGVWLYYMVELSANWSLLFSIFFFDTRRKDFHVMLIHHVSTIVLIGLSWVLSLFKVGVLVMICHDFTDIVLEMAKMCKYAGLSKVGDAFIVLFAVGWIGTRLMYYPGVILHSITVQAPQLIQYFNVYWIFNFLLSTLLLLNIIWSYFIFKVVYVALMNPEKEMDDSRSSSEDSSSEDDDDDDETSNGGDDVDNDALLTQQGKATQD